MYTRIQSTWRSSKRSTLCA